MDANATNPEHTVPPPRNKGGNPAWVPGVSGNPYGRPKKGETFKDCLNRLLEVPDEDARTRKQAICDAMIEAAAAGSLSCSAWIAERTEGKPAQTVEVSKKADLLQGLTDGEIIELIDAIKRKAIASSDNNGNAGT